MAGVRKPVFVLRSTEETAIPYNVHYPELGERLPRRGNWFSKVLSRLVFRVAGWQFDGALSDTAKAVVIVAPHTSNWDFIIGVIAIFALGVRFSWLGKHKLFRRPFTGFFRWLGGIPVDRTTSSGVVEQTIRRFHQRESMLLALSPEGTRKAVERWRTGFYHIAAGAGVVIVPVALDLSARRIVIGEPKMPSGAIDSDIEDLQDFFTGVAENREPVT